MSARQPTHSHGDSQSTAYSEDVDSVASTLQGTPRSISDDAAFEDIDMRKLHGRGKQVDESDGHESGHDFLGDSGDPNEDDDARDDARLLSGALEEPSGSIQATSEHVNSAPLLEVSDKPKPVGWADLPRKDQLVILVLARLSEPLSQTSLQSYMFYQLKSFKLPSGESPSDGTIARQAGLLAAAFTGAQFCTAVLWGRMADSPRMGRKRVILVGLAGTIVMSLGFGFSQSFAMAMFWRCIGGLMNGNVAVLRTMVSETIREKRYQSRAFLLMPMCFNIGVIIGPLLGGVLADPVGSYPSIFGPGGTIGGGEGVWWMLKWPYALPNVVNSLFLACSALAVVFGLEETLDALKHKRDYGIEVRKWVFRGVKSLFGRRTDTDYVAVSDQDRNGGPSDIEMSGGSRSKSSKTRVEPKRRLPFRRIWTRNVLFTILSHSMLTCHVSAFNNLWFVFLSTARYVPGYTPGTPFNTTSPTNTTLPAPLQQVPPNYTPHLPFVFTGGLALPPRSIGTALAILGTIGITMQLAVYPRIAFRLGPLRTLRWFMCLYPVAQTLAPFLATIPSSVAAPAPAGGALVWLGIAVVLCVQVSARTMAQPSSSILVNNSSPHPSVLGTVHGIAQSISSGTKTAGPAIAGYLYSVGLHHGVVGTAWWCMAAWSILGAFAAQLVREGDGHEIWLEGEKEVAEAEEREKVAEAARPSGS